MLFHPTNPKTYTDSTFKDAITLDGSLIAHGMGCGKIQQRFDEAGRSGKLVCHDDVKRDSEPYIHDGVPKKCTRPL